MQVFVFGLEGYFNIYFQFEGHPSIYLKFLCVLADRPKGCEYSRKIIMIFYCMTSS